MIGATMIGDTMNGLAMIGRTMVGFTMVGVTMVCVTMACVAIPSAISTYKKRGASSFPSGGGIAKQLATRTKATERHIQK